MCWNVSLYIQEGNECDRLYLRSFDHVPSKKGAIMHALHMSICQYVDFEHLVPRIDQEQFHPEGQMSISYAILGKGGIILCFTNTTCIRWIVRIASLQSHVQYTC